MIWLDYVMLLIPALAMTIWAQVRIVRALREGSRVEAGSGLRGAEVARDLLIASGVEGVSVEPAVGELANHYETRDRVLRLSPAVHDGRTLAAAAIAAHQAGHALQDDAGHPGRLVRNAVVPLAELGSQVVWMLMIAGLLLGMFRLVVLAITGFSLLVVLQLLNLPVELDASRRGRRLLVSTGLIGPDEEPAVARVLNASAWTHVAACLTGLPALLLRVARPRAGRLVP
ncbi:MAG: zinc metallopeptidase [Isosphaeraceae bacterium]